MLRGLALALTERGWAVTAVARRPGPLAALARAAAGGPGRLEPLAADAAAATFPARVDAALAGRPPLTRVVDWALAADDHRLAAHLDARAAARPAGSPLDYLRVLGSRAARGDAAARRAAFAPYARLRYREVVLGWVATVDGSRWLEHEEIVAGVLAALDDDAPARVVGRVAPWERRPAL